MRRHRFSRLFQHRLTWLMLSCLGWLGMGSAHAQQTYYGPPYTVQSAVLVGSYNSKEQAADALMAAWAPHCPGCSIQPVYTDPAKQGSAAAIIVLTSPGASPSTDAIYATSHYEDVLKTTGYCIPCSEAAGGKIAGASPSRSAGDASADSEGARPTGTSTADPVSVGNGNKFGQETDFRGGDWLTFRRFYNSLNPVPDANLGAQWRHSFSRKLEVLISATGTAYNGINQLILDRPDGSSEVFNQSSSGAWVPSSEDPDTITELKDANGVTTGYAAFFVGNRKTELYSPDGVLQSITDLSGAVTTLAYSDATTPATIAPKPGLLLSVTAPDGRALQFTYDISARVQSVTQPDGGVLTYSYDANNNLSTVTYPDTHTRQYLYNESSLVGSSLPHVMTGVLDENGTRYETTSYSSDGRVNSTQFALGADKTSFSFYSFVSNGVTPVNVTTPLGYTYRPGLVNVNGGYKVGGSSSNCGADCGEPWSSVTYDGNGWPTSFTDFNGNKTLTTYSPNGLLLKNVEASGTSVQRTTNTTWDGVFRNPLTRTIQDAGGNTVSQEGWVYNARGQALAYCRMDPSIPTAATYTCSVTGTAPVGVRRTTTTYCDAVDSTRCPIIGLVLTRKGPRTDVDDTTTYSYYMSDSALYHHGDLATVTDPLGHRTTFIAYDGAGHLISVADANGMTTSMTYTPRGWLASVTTGFQGEITTTYTYTPFGALETVTDPDGVVTTYGYDDAHRLTKITDAQGNYIQYTLNAVGKHVGEQVYASGGSTPVRSLSHQFNNLGQMVKTLDGLNHTILDASASGSYDANGSLVQSKDALGIQQKETLDALNRLSSTIANVNGSDTATRNTTTTLSQDALDRVAQVTDPSNLTTHYTYDGLDNQVGLQSPDTGSSTDTFDAAGNVLTHTDAKGVVSTFTYDALNRVLTVSYTDASLNVAYYYDESNFVTGCAGGFGSQRKGYLTRVVENAVTTAYCYDDRGNVIQKRQTQSAVTDTTTYVYTLASRISQVAYPSGALVQYTRNNLGQITSVTATPSGGATQTVVSNVTYLPFGPVSGYELGNGQQVTRTYDANYRLTDLTSPNFNLHFLLDSMGNITALGNAPGVASPIETYTYDPLYHLTGVLDGQGSPIESYTYNQTGDRLSKTSVGGLSTGTYGYQSGTHWLTSIGNSARSYDLNGNTTGNSTGGQTFGFGYGGRNRLTVAQANNATVGTYSYNAMGERINKLLAQAQVSQRFAYDENSQLLGEYGSSSRDYVWMGNLPIGVVDGSGPTSSVNFVVADGLGTPRSISNASGSQVWQWQYQSNPFGEKQPTSTSGFAFNLRYPGQYFDAERGVAYNVNRDYDAEVGRYLQSDPFGLFAGTDTYAYVTSSPYSFSDMFGLQVDINLFDKKRDFSAWNAANNYQGDPGECTVAGHGNTDLVGSLRADILANKIRRTASCKGKPVRLLACSAGAVPEESDHINGGKPYGWNLSRSLHQVVWAPSTWGWFMSDGSFRIYETNGEENLPTTASPDQANEKGANFDKPGHFVKFGGGES
ncbi:RHS repeat-associated core domain-containing protein [Dyella sp.]|uniref:RHS repeat-associated core domain-containing protein n=1 Tax=Dyella sp. TaxID=1869338 RepID=UPI002ED09835